MHCPSCGVAMEAVTFRTHIGTPVVVDVCTPCHLIWFDHLESSSLSAESVIDLFRRIHAARSEPRNIVRLQVDCPVCRGKLQNGSDLAKGGRFNYSRCPSGHGRLIAFTQFLREKNFIRTLQPHEITTLAVSVKQIRCSSCGGPVDLEADKACRHCGSAISVLDEAAVEKALSALHDKTMAARRPATAPAAVDARVEAILASERMRRDYPAESRPAGLAEMAITGGVLGDLVEIGVGALLASWLE